MDTAALVAEYELWLSQSMTEKDPTVSFDDLAKLYRYALDQTDDQSPPLLVDALASLKDV